MKTTKDYTLHIICGMILFAALFSCKDNGTTDTPLSEITGEDNFHTKIIDGCEYIYKYCGYQRGYVFTHKGNCKNHNNNNQVFGKYSDTTSYKPFVMDMQPFYDGEGNVIPDKIVRLFVQSQFVKMTKPETDSVNKYFYFNK